MSTFFQFRFVVFIVLSVFIGLKNGTAQIYPLDSAFGINGSTIIPIQTFTSTRHQIASQSDGKILLSTSITAAGNIKYDFCLIRLNSTGVIDSSFGENGLALVDAGSKEDYAYDLKVLPDDKIVIAGTSGNVNNWDFVIAMLTPDGSPDLNFGENGITMLSKTNSDIFLTIEIDSNGRLLAAGYTNGLAIIVRFLGSGILDTSFGNNGIIELNHAGTNGTCIANDIAINSNGEIYIVGEIGGSKVQGFVTKLDSTGIIISDFATNGTYKFPSNKYSHFYSCELTEDGSILVSGNQINTTPTLSSDFLILRLLGNGDLDTTFGGVGYINIKFNRPASVCYKIIRSNSSAIFAVGYSDEIQTTNSDVSLAKILNDGSLDLTWGSEGKASYEFGSTNDVARGAIIDLNERLVISGFYSDDFFPLLCRFKTSIFDNIKPDSETIILTLSPNPCNGYINVELPVIQLDTDKLNFFGLDGKQYYPEAISVNSSIISLNTSKLPTGIYVVEYQDKGKLYTAKLLKN